LTEASYFLASLTSASRVVFWVPSQGLFGGVSIWFANVVICDRLYCGHNQRNGGLPQGITLLATIFETKSLGKYINIMTFKYQLYRFTGSNIT